MPYKVIHTIFDLFFPVRCAGCGAAGAHICPSCALEASYRGHECFFCSIKGGLGNLCERCKNKSPIEGIWWPWRYNNDKTKKIIAAYKYRRKDWFAPLLAGYIQKVLDTSALPSDIVVIPVPLHPARQRERGFNQAREIARGLPFPVLDGIAVRAKDTLSQARTHSRRERYEHMRGAFAIKNPKKIAGRNILIVDDVATTGATITELASTLKKAGAAKIYAAVLAHG